MAAKTLGAAALVLGCLSGCFTAAEDLAHLPTSAGAAGVPVTTLHCKVVGTPGYGYMGRWNLGRVPRLVPLANEKNPGVVTANTDPRDQDRYVRAASGLVLWPASKNRLTLLVAQDSRRHLARVDLPLVALAKSPAKSPEPGVLPDLRIRMLATAEAATIASLEDPRRDYASYRKGHKADYEAATTLPDGRILILGSGSDIKSDQDVKSDRQKAVLLAPNGQVTTFDLLPFYKSLLKQAAIVGAPINRAQPRLNIEGVAVHAEGSGGRLISFAHRGNINSNGHNAVVSYAYEEWLTTLVSAAPAWDKLAPRGITVLRLPSVEAINSSPQVAVPLTINDLLVVAGASGQADFALLPVGAEAEYVDKSGQHQDGVVVFAGMLKLQGIDGHEPKSCHVYQARGEHPPGAKSRYGKIEGLALWRQGGEDLVLGVTDVDSEVTPAVLSTFQLVDFLRLP